MSEREISQYSSALPIPLRKSEFSSNRLLRGPLRIRFQASETSILSPKDEGVRALVSPVHRRDSFKIKESKNLNNSLIPSRILPGLSQSTRLKSRDFKNSEVLKNFDQMNSAALDEVREAYSGTIKKLEDYNTLKRKEMSARLEVNAHLTPLEKSIPSAEIFQDMKNEFYIHSDEPVYAFVKVKKKPAPLALLITWEKKQLMRPVIVYASKQFEKPTHENCDFEFNNKHLLMVDEKNKKKSFEKIDIYYFAFTCKDNVSIVISTRFGELLWAREKFRNGKGLRRYYRDKYLNGELGPILHTEEGPQNESSPKNSAENSPNHSFDKIHKNMLSVNSHRLPVKLNNIKASMAKNEEKQNKVVERKYEMDVLKRHKMEFYKDRQTWTRLLNKMEDKYLTGIRDRIFFQRQWMILIKFYNFEAFILFMLRVWARKEVKRLQTLIKAIRNYQANMAAVMGRTVKMRNRSRLFQTILFHTKISSGAGVMRSESVIFDLLQQIRRRASFKLKVAFTVNKMIRIEKRMVEYLNKKRQYLITLEAIFESYYPLIIRNIKHPNPHIINATKNKKILNKKSSIAIDNDLKRLFIRSYWKQRFEIFVREVTQYLANMQEIKERNPALYTFIKLRFHPATGGSDEGEIPVARKTLSVKGGKPKKRKSRLQKLRTQDEIIVPPTLFETPSFDEVRRFVLLRTKTTSSKVLHKSSGIISETEEDHHKENDENESQLE